MSWLENLKVDDKACVKVSHLGHQQDDYYIGIVTKVTKTKVLVSVLGHTSTFNLPSGESKRTGKWDTPDQLVELTPEVRELVARRRLSQNIEKRLSTIKVRDLNLEQLKSLSAFLDSLNS